MSLCLHKVIYFGSLLFKVNTITIVFYLLVTLTNINHGFIVVKCFWHCLAYLPFFEIEIYISSVIIYNLRIAWIGSSQHLANCMEIWNLSVQQKKIAFGFVVLGHICITTKIEPLLTVVSVAKPWLIVVTMV